MIRVPLSRHTIHPVALEVEAAKDAVRLRVHDQKISELTPGEAKYLAEALIDAAERVEEQQIVPLRP